MTNAPLNINNPIDTGKKTIEDIFNQNKKLLNAVTFISKAIIQKNTLFQIRTNFSCKNGTRPL